MGLQSNAEKREDGLLENHLSFAFHEIRGIADAAIARGVTSRKTGTVEKWTFQLITPTGRLSLIASARRPVTKRRGRGRGEGGDEERYEKARVASRDLSISRGRRNFLNYNALISLVFLSFPLSPVFFCQTRANFLLGLPTRVICSTTRCGSNNYYAPNVVNLIYSFSVRTSAGDVVRAIFLFNLLSSHTNE